MDVNRGNGNGDGRPVVELSGGRYPVLFEAPPAIRSPRKRPFLLALILFVLTVISTLAVGSEFSISYAQNRAPYSGVPDPFTPMYEALIHPHLLLAGLPFSLTLISILLVHELGHFFTCRYYHIESSYPYFLPAPTLIGTFGAFIRIRSPILNRKALFDVGFSGPLAGFLLAVPVLAGGVYFSRVVPHVQDTAFVIFGSPPLMKFFIAVLHPGVRSQDLLLNPVALAAWVGLFVTALNLLPIGQLDGGHILYGVAAKNHHRISIALAIALIPMGIFLWPDWLVFAVLLFFLGYRHPPLIDFWTPLDRARRAWAVVALLIFLLCFTPLPVRVPHP